MKLVFISDTHSRHSGLIIPECDILFHCGDWTGLGDEGDVREFAKWLEVQPAKYIVITPGNHEVSFSKKLPQSRSWITDHCPRANVLIHESVEIQGIKIFGSPWTPFFFNWSWNAGRTLSEAAYYFKPFIGDLWQDIPEDINILLTHGPAYEILDRAVNWYDKSEFVYVGCEELSKRIKALKELKIHAFGHLHYDGGKTETIDDVIRVNAAICDDDYKPLNKIVTLKY